MSEPERPIPFAASLPFLGRGWAPFAFVALFVVATAALGLRFGIGASILVLAAAALMMVITMAFRAVQSIAEPDEDAGLLDEVPTPALMQKQVAFKALKDLEFERSVGNIGDADYAEIHARYREEAKRAMRAVDEERRELRARAEQLAADATADRGAEEAEEPAADDEKDDEKDDENAEEPAPLFDPRVEKKAENEPGKVACAECGTKNDPDAKFCKSCGGKMGEKEVEA